MPATANDTEDLEFKSINNPDEVESTISFLLDNVNHKLDMKVWRWEWETFPEKTVRTILKDKNTIVATQFILPIILKVKSLEVLSGKCENSYCHSNYRGKGLWEKLVKVADADALRKSMKLLWGFTPAIKVYANKLGFSTFPASRFTATLGMPHIASLSIYSGNSLKDRLKYIYYSIYYFPRFISFWSRLKKFSFRINYSRQIKRYTVSSSIPQWDDFNKMYATLTLTNENLIHIDFNRAYYNWRITNNINLDYLTRFFYLNGELVGYYIVAIKDRVANVSDFTYLKPENSEVMLCNLLQELSGLNMDRLNYFGNTENDLNKNTFNLFQKFGGAVSNDQGMHFVFKHISDFDTIPETSFLHDPKNWYLNGLWTEGFTY